MCSSDDIELILNKFQTRIAYCASHKPCTAIAVPHSDHSAAGSVAGRTDEIVKIKCDTGYAGGGDATCVANAADANADGEFKGFDSWVANACAPTKYAFSDHAAAGSITGFTGDVVKITCIVGYQGGGDARCVGRVDGSIGGFEGVSKPCDPKPCTATAVPNSDQSAVGSVSGVTGNIVKIQCDAGYDGGGDATCDAATGVFVGDYDCTAKPCTATAVPNSDHATVVHMLANEVHWVGRE
jgi:hypothetical protein